MNAEEWNKKEDLLQEQGNYRIIVLDHRPLQYIIAQTYIIHKPSDQNYNNQTRDCINIFNFQRFVI